MIGIFLSAAMLCGIMYVVARHEAEYDFVHVLLVAAGLFVGNLILGVAIGEFAVIVMYFVTAWVLQKYCYLQWGKSFVVTTIYYAIQIGVSWTLALI